MNDELMHIGMPGRSGRYRWGSGKRPFQRLEGTAGFDRAKQKKLPKETKKVRIKDLSDAELKKITDRITLENSYYEARAKLKKNTSKESKVKSVAKKIAEESVTIMAKNLADSYSRYLGKKFWGVVGGSNKVKDAEPDPQDSKKQKKKPVEPSADS